LRWNKGSRKREAWSRKDKLKSTLRAPLLNS
jgi:hypothetical protein